MEITFDRIFLSRLRNLEDQTIKIINDMPITYDIEKDGLYRKGEAKGFEKGIKKGVTKGKAESDENAIIGMYQFGIAPENIAQVLKLSLDYVKEIIETINKD